MSQYETGWENLATRCFIGKKRKFVKMRLARRGLHYDPGPAHGEIRGFFGLRLFRRIFPKEIVAEEY
jgi:hypothetical protein